MSNRVVGCVCAILCELLCIRTASALVGRLDPCATPGSISKVHMYACLPPRPDTLEIAKLSKGH